MEIGKTQAEMSQLLSARDLVEWEMFFRWRAAEQDRLQSEARTRAAASNARQRII